jgi:hypothetical protein
MVEEYNERRFHAKQLMKLLEESNGSTNQITYHLPKRLENLPHHHIKTLAGANSICSTQFILRYSPSTALKMWLEDRAKEIAQDDELLSHEGVNELAIDDLQLACLRRGLNPSLDQGSIEKLREYLNNWIDSPLSKHCRTSEKLPISLLSHATALPEVFLDTKVFEKFPLHEIE